MHWSSPRVAFGAWQDVALIAREGQGAEDAPGWNACLPLPCSGAVHHLKATSRVAPWLLCCARPSGGCEPHLHVLAGLLMHSTNHYGCMHASHPLCRFADQARDVSRIWLYMVGNYWALSTIATVGGVGRNRVGRGWVDGCCCGTQGQTFIRLGAENPAMHG